MSARDKILSAVTANKPGLIPLPEIVVGNNISGSLLEEFTAVLTRIGGTPVIVDSIDDVAKDINRSLQAGDEVVNTIPGLSDVNNAALSARDATSLEPVYKAYVRGTLGVAENGAVWLYESQMVNRLLPFICQHLVIVLNAAAIVANMHEAYGTIDAASEGYGVFLAGPSKTADIEQSLVIGAHGARSLLVYLIRN